MHPEPAGAMHPEPGGALKDPICGMKVDPAKSKAAGRFAERGGVTYYFCSDDCREKFLAQGAPPPAPAAGAPMGHEPGHQHD